MEVIRWKWKMACRPRTGRIDLSRDPGGEPLGDLGACPRALPAERQWVGESPGSQTPDLEVGPP